MKTVELTLNERAARMYRRLLILQRVFQPGQEGTDDWQADDDGGSDMGLSAAVREVLDELTEQARIFATIPYPISDWRPGDGSDDDRWRALTEVERREVLSIIVGYDALVAWSEDVARGQMEYAGLAARADADAVGRLPSTLPRMQTPRDALEYLKAERARIERVRQDLRFLEKRRTEAKT
jgi:hypothetical protein